AIHDRMAAIETERILEIVEPLSGRLVPAVADPALRLQQRGGSEKAFAVPPIAWTGGAAACTEDTFVEAVELGAVIVRLLPLLVRRRRSGAQPRLDRGVLGVEIA